MFPGIKINFVDTNKKNYRKLIEKHIKSSSKKRQIKVGLYY